MTICSTCPDSCGYVPVGREYVNLHAPLRPPPFPHPETAQERAVNQAVADADNARRASVEATVYPCPECNVDQYDAWVAGEWPVKKAKRRDPPVPEPTRVTDGLPYKDARDIPEPPASMLDPGF